MFEALRAYNNLVVLVMSTDRDEEALPLLGEALALARRRGDRFWEASLLAGLCEDERLRGAWDAALEHALDLVSGSERLDSSLASAAGVAARIHIDRADHDAGRDVLTRLPSSTDTADVQLRGLAQWRRQLEAELDGRFDDAFEPMTESIVDSADLVPTSVLAELLRDAATYATLTGNHAAALDVAARIDFLPATIHVRALDSQLHRLRANAAASAGDEEVAADAYALALAAARNLGYPFWLAPVLADYSAWLQSIGRVDDAAPLVREARELFEGMGATVWLRRLDAVAPTTATV